MDFGRSNTPEAAGLATTTSENAILAGQPELRTKPQTNGKSKKQGLHIVVCARLDIGSLIRDVETILQGADEDQAALTKRYIEAGRRLWALKEAHREEKRQAAAIKQAPETFDEFLGRSFPRRKRSTLREYMTLAKAFDAADQATKVQLAGHFKHGWGPVLGEIRRRKRLKKSQDKNGQPAEGDAKGDALSILLGDCMVRLRELPDNSVDCVITSVPYFQRLVFPGATTVFGGDQHCVHDWEKRQFVRPVWLLALGFTSRVTRNFNNTWDTIESGTCRKCGAQLVMLGWEDTVAEYVRHLVEVFKEVRLVLKPTGVAWLNIADKFLDKELLLVPHQLAIALKDHGWICRGDPIWHVTNRAPESTRDRFYCNHEHLFMFAKQKDHYFDAAATRERAISAAKPGTEVRFKRQVDFREHAGTWRSPGIVPDGMRNPRTVWSIPNEPFRGGHHCAFPKRLVERMMLSSCPEGGVCLDPFAGTGTIGLVALAHAGRQFLSRRARNIAGPPSTGSKQNSGYIRPNWKSGGNRNAISVILTPSKNRRGGLPPPRAV
jgi:DNA modification methylase